MAMIYPYLFINGEVCARDEARIPIWDLGLLRGYGIFDFFKVMQGIPVFIENHIDRLTDSLRLTDLDPGVSGEQWKKWFYQMIETNQADQAGFRVVVTGGFSEDGYTLPERKNIFMMLHQFPVADQILYENGVTLLSADYLRDIPAAKTTIYVQSMQYQSRLQTSGAYEVLYHSKGLISECSKCNMFFIDREGGIHTPGSGILKGITRRQIIGIAQRDHLPLRERDIYMDELPQMAGAFLTSTTKGALPVVKIDDQVIGDGTVHPLAARLQTAYLQQVEAYIAQAQGHRS